MQIAARRSARLASQPALSGRSKPPAQKVRPARQVVAHAPVRFDQRPPLETDGFWVGRGKLAHPPGADPAAVAAIRPAQGPVAGRAYYVNGQGNFPDEAYTMLQQYADRTGREVVGIYNGAEAGPWDPINYLQPVADKFGLPPHPPIHSVEKLIWSHLRSGEPVQLAGHSHGGLIIARALERVEARLKAEGHTPRQVRRMLAPITVETLGGAGAQFPDGPRYVHYVNRADSIPMLFGVGVADPSLVGPELGVDTRPGSGASVIVFDAPDRDVHAPATYLDFYRAPEEAASHPNRMEVPSSDTALNFDLTGLAVRIGRWVVSALGLAG